MTFVFHFSKTAAILTVLAFLTVSCAREKTEEELYKDVISSLKYKTYKLASSSTVPPAVQIYNSNLQKGEPAADEMFLRLLLAEQLAEIEKTAGDVNSSLFWPKAISSILFKELKNASNDQLRRAVTLTGDLIKRLRI